MGTDWLAHEEGEAPEVIWLDLQMLAMAGGRERTEAESGDLLAAAGLALARVLPTQSGFCVLEAVPAAAA